MSGRLQPDGRRSHMDYFPARSCAGRNSDKWKNVNLRENIGGIHKEVH